VWTAEIQAAFQVRLLAPGASTAAKERANREESPAPWEERPARAGEPRAFGRERQKKAGQEARPTGRIDYVRIATKLRDPRAVLEAVRVSTRRSPLPAAPVDQPHTPVEKQLAELWAALLNIPAVGIRDNFFELGGHSLLAVQLLSRVRQVHGVDLSLEVVYSGAFTVVELAKAIELKEIEQSGADYRELLAELEALSDEEVRELLAKEQGTP
jgi:acyl carrier protein